ncbi:DUF4145 domain-containing protein [Candidatus Woesearchaeota archaeon]|nr:DUF4145 domain-containing protein [Candidatus Woesearchaeota archaeon]
MGLEQFLTALKAVEKSYEQCLKGKATHDKFYTFSGANRSYHEQKLYLALQSFKQEAWKLAIPPPHEDNERELLQLLQIVTEIQPSTLPVSLEKIKKMVPLLEFPSSQSTSKQAPKQVMIFTLPQLPTSIQEEMIADFQELRKCFTATCYRSAVILCGRVLETCLYRKYYEATGKDLLATAPDIGLGKLIAKLSEAQVLLDPGIHDQIHLINKVRIYSVHKKATVFYPSKEQCHAMILYTMDTIRRLFEHSKP